MLCTALNTAEHVQLQRLHNGVVQFVLEKIATEGDENRKCHIGPCHQIISLYIIFLWFKKKKMEI